MKSKVFIGSSVEGLGIAYALQQNLKHDAEVTVWNQGVFELSKTTIESLTEVLDRSDFGIFVFSPDDILKIRDKTQPAVRDNVIFELGLFIGKLGRTKTFIVIPEHAELHIPSDLIGITPGYFETERKDGSLEAATGPVCHQIRQQIKKQIILNPTLESPLSQTEDVNEKENGTEVTWVNSFIRKEYDPAIKNLRELVDSESDEEKLLNLNGWLLYMEYLKAKGLHLEKLEEFLRKNNHPSKSYEFIGRFLLWENDLPKAKKIISEGLDKFGNQHSLLLLKVDYLEKIGDIDEAINLLESSDYYNDEQLSLKLCTLYEISKKDLNKAREVIHKSYIANSQSETICFKYALVSQNIGNPKVALYLLGELTQRYPKKSDYWGYLSNSCVSLNLHDQAMVTAQKGNEAATSEPAWILSNIGNIYNYKGLYSAGINCFKRSLEIDNDSEYTHTKLASAINAQQEESKKYSTFVAEGRKEIMNFQASLTEENNVPSEMSK